METGNPQRFFPFGTLLLLAGLLLAGCGIEDFTEPEYLSPVQDLAVFPHDGYLTLRFTSVNSEQRFDGFNVYLSTSSAVPNQSLEPLDPLGVLPTIPAQAVSAGSSQVVTWDLRRDFNNALLVNSTTYYLVIRAHSTRESLSDPCNETATTPRPESVTQVSLAGGQGFSLRDGDSLTPWDFELVQTNSLLWLRPLAGASLKDEGYYPDPALYNEVQTNGFPAAGVLIQAVAGHVCILRTSDRFFGKVYFDSVQAGSIGFRWAFQLKPGNLHI